MLPQNMLSKSGLRYNGLKHFLQFPTELTTINHDGFTFGEIPSMSSILVDFLSPSHKCWDYPISPLLKSSLFSRYPAFSCTSFLPRSQKERETLRAQGTFVRRYEQ